MAGPLDITFPPDGDPGDGVATVADGADVAQGAVADAAAAAGGTGTISAKLRKISADIAAVLTAMSDGTQKVISGNTLAASAPTAFPLGLNDINGQIRIAQAGSVGDSLPYAVAAQQYAWTGGANNRVRMTNIFKTASATASGNTAVWTPTASKKFRLMRFQVFVPANAAISGGGVIVTVKFQDATTDIGVAMNVFIPTTALTTTVGGWSSGWIDLGQGILSAAANNVLNVNLSAALTTGNVQVTVCGTEE